MDFPLPSGYTRLCDVEQLPLHTMCTVVGTVTDWLPPMRTRGPDWSCKVMLKDPSELDYGGPGVSSRLFMKPDPLLTRSLSIGDFMVLRNIRIKELFGQKVLLENQSDGPECLFFASKSIPDEGFSAAHVSDENRQIDFWTLPGRRCSALRSDEQFCLIKLKAWARDNAGILPQAMQRAQNSARLPLPPKPLEPAAWNNESLSKPAGHNGSLLRPPPGISFKFSYLCDVQVGRYHALVGEVRKVFNARNCVEISVTDYTYNPLFYDYKEYDESGAVGRDGDPHGYLSHNTIKQEWKGPWGKHTIQITLWEPHSNIGKDLGQGDIVYIHNARFTQKEGHPLQASVHQDRSDPGKLHIRKLESGHEWTYPLLDLRKQYWDSRDSSRKPMAKAEKKKKKREAKKAAVLHQRAAQTGLAPGVEREDTAEGGLFVSEPRDELNGNIVAAYTGQQWTPLSNIVETLHRTYRDRHGEERTLPFVNMKCKTRVRVVDFFPPDLADFARCLDHSDYNDTSSQLDPTPTVCSSSSTTGGRWEWAFYLLVEDPRTPTAGQQKARLPLLVHGLDGEALLGINATDLHYNQQVCNQVKQKLFLLWGDLQELKASGDWSETTKLANRPFECNIMEYGHKENNEYRRMHRIFQTSIRG